MTSYVPTVGLDSGHDAVIIGRVSIADAYLARIGADQDAWDDDDAREELAAAEDLPADEAEAQILAAATRPVMWLVIKLAVNGLPGIDAAQDAEWAAMTAQTRRQVLIDQRAGLDDRLAGHQLRLLARIDSLIGTWPEPEWTEAVRSRVTGLVEARHNGRQRGQQLRGNRASVEPTIRSAVGALLRHPTDHYFRMARASVTDPWLCAHLDQQIAMLAPRYTALAGRDWSAEEMRAGLVAEVQVPDQVPAGWHDPIPATVIGAQHGSLAVGSQLGIRLVADPAAPFNGTLLSVLAGERWLICGEPLDDETVLPADGTRRTHPS